MARLKKLFEYIVVRDQLKGQVKNLTAQLAQTFINQRHLFEEKRRTVTPVTEGGRETVEEQSDIQTTVMHELRRIAAPWAKAIDAARQVEEANTAARADVILDDERVLLAQVPTTALLELVQRADDIYALLTSVPTLDPAKAFRPDETREIAGIFKAREVVKTRTKKVTTHEIVVPATDHHAAQVASHSEDVPAATVIEQEWSGMVTPAVKAAMLERAEELRRAFRSALHRANATELQSEPVAGKAIFDFVFGEQP